MGITITGGVTIGAVTITPPSVPVITINSQPSSTSASAGSTATFSVSASVTLSASLSYQWQLQAGGSGSYSPILGATSSSYTTGTLSSGDNNNNYRVVVSATGGANSVTSSVAALTVSSASNDTMIVAFVDSGGNNDVYGASDGERTTAIGTITSDYLSSVEATLNIYDNTAYSYIYLKPGTYTGFSVGVDGAIDNDTPSYPRIFTINGNTYQFAYDINQLGYYIPTSCGLENLTGQTIPVLYDPATQPTVLPNTMFVNSYTSPYGGGTTYGASNQGQIIGYLISDYFAAIEAYISGPSVGTTIQLNDGVYSGFSVSNGAIDGDSGAGAFRVFTVDNVNYALTLEGSAPHYNYAATSDIFGLQSNLYQVLSVIYDPAAQGGGANTAAGTLQVGSNGYGGYGFGSGFGSINLIPPFVVNLSYEGSSTVIVFESGTWDGIVVNSTSIDGQTSVTVTVDGVTKQGTLSSGGPGCIVSFTGDAFSLASKNGQVLDVTIDAGTGGGGSGTTYTVSTNYADYPGPGAYFDMGTFYANGPQWLTPAGFTALTALGNGSSFTVTMPGSGTSYTITLTSSWNTSGMPYQVSFSSPTLPPQTYGPSSVPASITIGGGGGGGGTVVTLSPGSQWGPGTSLTLYVSGGNTAAITAMDAAGSNPALTLTDNTSSPTTANVTVSGTLNKSGPVGPGLYMYSGTTTTSNLNYPMYSTLASVTLSGGGGGGGTSMTGIYYLNYSDDSHTLTILFGSQANRDAAYALINAPGTWSIVGNYQVSGGSFFHGSYTLTPTGPSSTANDGPPGGNYVITTPAMYSGAVSDGSSQPPGGTFTATKTG